MVYDQDTAFHYAAYRPPVHQRILADVLNKDDASPMGLDIGCGTGHSSIALADYCQKVIGIDPSPAMIARATVHPRVEYMACNGHILDFKNDSFNIITFAGSWYYAKSQKCLNEVIRVSKDAAKVIIYDFDILLGDILRMLDIDLPKPTSAYDHAVNFSGLDQKYIRFLKEMRHVFYLDIRLSHLAHLLLSSRDFNHHLRHTCQIAHPFDHLVRRLNQIIHTTHATVMVNTYCTLYEILK